MTSEPSPQGVPLDRPVPADELLAAPDESGTSRDLQILSTEHWSLLATRALTWNESFARAQMFLSVLSGTVIALALVAQATAFGDGFTAFALVLLPVVLFLGTATFVRLVAVNNDEGRWVIGMNRIRSGYLEISPRLEKYFVTGYHDDVKGVMLTGGWGEFPTLFGFVTTPAIIAVISAVVAGVIAYLVADLLGVVTWIAGAAGGLVFLTWTVAANRYEAAQMRRSGSKYRPISPTPDRDASEG